MDFRYLPMTETDKQEMLKTIGVATTEELFADIPEKIRYKGEMNLRAPLNETALMKELQQLSDKNADLQSYPSFLGAGVYDHYIPSIVDHVIRRSEFYTAYTPYQPEISQGELQAIFEFQTMICELTGMDIANSSMYDGHTALAEAALVAGSQHKSPSRKILVSEGVHPESLHVIETYASGPGIVVETIPLTDGKTDMDALEKQIDEHTAGVILQYPNFYGSIEDLKAAEKLIHQYKSLFIVSSNPLALGVLKSPGSFGADIVTGDAQPFGIPTQFGGPHCGYFTTTKKLMRKVPGRLVGQTEDEDGIRGFVLTLQTREQHIRRDKATSNICSNQALNALAASVAMTALGRQGVKEMAAQNVKKTHYMKKQLQQAGIQITAEQPVFNEFVIQLPDSADKINRALFERGIIGGYDLEQTKAGKKGQMLLCVTDKRSKAEIDLFVEELKGVLA
ncbi:glycine dehydrogenase (decarboxylating) alpha subunit [Sinobaca qinghaiensis]|uniref:Probable glycine dehydrogenase (decarboxylating) subunit 1 n=1 Tax=Sinobaca qinghaiensis TaxID=342944 RepID=A0A419V3J4_9BACL|nr:aminomethyl-transferring glycine dehydrogenase subunit GcvPA [Sinobaca qinghaiensis]RKD72976.1 glycine dehydrogenase (decarboxylating) alpha subunit [Sinobaca qinghaiensis]